MFTRTTTSTSTTCIYALVLAAMLPAACASTDTSSDPLSQARDRGVLRVALTEANPPWNFLDRNGQPVGYDVDVAHELAKRLAVPRVEFIATDFKNFIDGIRSSRFDIVISGQTITPQRRQQVEFSRPYEVNGVSIFVRTSETSLRNLADLRGKRIAVSEGTTQAEYARTYIPQADVKTYGNATLSLTDVARGRADAALVSRFQGAYLAANSGLKVKAAGPLLESEVNGMTFRKDAPELRNAVDTAIAGMIADGTLTTISKRWLGGLDMASELRKLPTGQAG
jgi:cystine transport system substrate-binding protein